MRNADGKWECGGRNAERFPDVGAPLRGRPERLDVAQAPSPGKITAEGGCATFLRAYTGAAIQVPCDSWRNARKPLPLGEVGRRPGEGASAGPHRLTSSRLTTRPLLNRCHVILGGCLIWNAEVGMRNDGNEEVGCWNADLSRTVIPNSVRDLFARMPNNFRTPNSHFRLIEVVGASSREIHSTNP